MASSDRAFIPAFVRDARVDANAWSRYELCRKARYERRNNWLLKRLQSVDVKYTVGPYGHRVIPASSDTEWNKRMRDAYERWGEAPFRDSSLPLSQGHQLLRKEMHIDGEAFAHGTYLKVSGSRSMPAIELIESHRVSSPGKDFDTPFRTTKDDAIGDGVQYGVDSDGVLIGRELGYHVRLGLNGERWKFVPSFNPNRPIDGGLIRLADPDRIGMARVVSEYAPVLNEISDLFLLSMLEVDKAKANAAYAGVLETWSGEAPGGFQGRYANSGGISSGLPVPGRETDKQLEARIQQMAKVIQAKIMAVKPGEKMTWSESKSPSAATQWLWKFVIERVCVSRDIPLVLVLPSSVQGTTLRAVLDDAQIGFNLQFSINARVAIAWYRFFADWARFNVSELSGAPLDWFKCVVVPPPSINTDFGRNMSAMIDGINAGIYDYDAVIGRDGGIAEERMLKKARQVAAAKKIAKQVSAESGEQIDVSEIIGAPQASPKIVEDDDDDLVEKGKKKDETESDDE